MSRSLCRLLLPLFLGLLLLGCSPTEKVGAPGQAVESFYQHLNERNYRAAIALYNAEAREILDDPNAATPAGFAEWAQLETKDGRVDSIHVVQEQAEETTATVDYEIVYRDGTRATRNVSMTQNELLVNRNE